MSTTAVPSKDTASNASVGKVAMKLEVVSIPVSDVDRAKAFYSKLGWRLDADFTVGESSAVQFTPRAPRPRSTSAATSARSRPAPRRACC